MSTLLPVWNGLLGVQKVLPTRPSARVSVASPAVHRIRGRGLQISPRDRKRWSPARPGQRGCRIFSLVPDPSADTSNADEGNAVEGTGSPRRSTRLTFTCDKCGERTERLVNPLALAKGLVIVQCGGCEAWHKITDHENLIQEFDFREKNSDSSDA